MWVLCVFLLFPCIIHAQDTDGDGVFDVEDLDTDNDGILDSRECSVNLLDWTGVGPIAPGSSDSKAFALADGSMVTVTVANDATSAASVETVVLSSERPANGFLDTATGRQGLRPVTVRSTIVLTYTFSQPVDVLFTDGEFLSAIEPVITASSDGNVYVGKTNRSYGRQNCHQRIGNQHDHLRQCRGLICLGKAVALEQCDLTDSFF